MFKQIVYHGCENKIEMGEGCSVFSLVTNHTDGNGNRTQVVLHPTLEQANQIVAAIAKVKETLRFYLKQNKGQPESQHIPINTALGLVTEETLADPIQNVWVLSGPSGTWLFHSEAAAKQFQQDNPNISVALDLAPKMVR